MNNNKIIIIDDDPDITSMYRELLSNRFIISAFDSGKVALESIEKTEHNICLILLDYKLPDMTGIEALKALKNVKPSVPVLFITGYGNESIAVSAFRQGAKDYLKKPFIIEELLSKVNFLSSITSFVKVKEKRQVLSNESCQIADKLLYNVSISCKTECLNKVLYFIDRSYKEKLKLDTLAKVAGLSKFHFSRIFKEVTGVTIQNHVLRIRIDKAKEMLKNGNYSIAEVAFSVGFSDLTNFGRSFKKTVGCTPMQYRNNHETAATGLKTRIQSRSATSRRCKDI